MSKGFKTTISFSEKRSLLVIIIRLPKIIRSVIPLPIRPTVQLLFD